MNDPGTAHPRPAAVALSIENVSKVYTPLTFLGLGHARARSRAVHALRGLSFTVQEGETIGLLGPNGAGKTTLLKIMATLIHSSGGRVILMGRDVAEHPRWARSMMGLITCDERSFYWRLSGRHNLRFFASLYGVPKRVAEQRMEALLETLELADAADRPYHSYSSGMKQKLAIARGFIADPRVLFYDEPMRSLDPISAHRIRGWIVAQRRNSPRQVHVIATNHLHEAEQLCDRVLIIDRGELLAQGPIREICARWQVREHETHTLVVHGCASARSLGIDPGMGLLDISERASGDALTLRLRVRRASGALSKVLEAILRSGGTVASVQTDRESFDAVFYKMLRDERAPEEARANEGFG